MGITRKYTTNMKWRPLVEFDVISALEQFAYDNVHKRASHQLIDKVTRAIGATALTEPNWYILGEYIDAPACELMSKSRRK